MTIKQRLDEKKYNFFIQICIYTCFFIVTAIGVYLAFIVCERTLLRNGDGNIDGIAQAYPVYGYIKHCIENGVGIDPWSWSIGLGASPIDCFKSKILNPLTYIIIAFPEKYLDIGYSIVTVIREYLTGISFLFFAKHVKFNQIQGVVGALCYAFSGWAIVATNNQGSFTDAMICLPILIVGIEKVINERKPVVFIVSIIMFFSSGVIWAYIGGITAFAYYITRYFELKIYKCGLNIDVLKDFAKFIFYGIIGMMISSFIIMSMIISMINSTTEAQSEKYTTLYTLKDYITLPNGFFEFNSVNTPYSVLYIPIICIVFLPIIVMRIRDNFNTPGAMSIILFIASFFPIIGKVFNGFSYTVGRWYFVLVFFIVWASMECFTSETIKSRKNVMISAIFLIILCMWNILICYGWLQISDINTVWSSCIGLSFGLMILFLLHFRGTGFRCLKTKFGHGFISNIINFCVIILLIGSIIGTSNMSFYPGVSDMLYKLEKTGSINSKFKGSTQRCATILEKEDADFYRTDQVDGYNDKRVARMIVNENIYWGYRSIYSYFSTINSTWLEFNKLMGNNCGYFDRTISFSNDNRAALDTLMGVKYFLGDSDNKRKGASLYKPYGFEYYDSIEGVEVFKNKYDIGLGTLFDSYITESELKGYSPLEREQVLMQTVSIPDDAKSEIKNVVHKDENSIKTEINEIKYSITDLDNMNINMNGSMTVYNGGGSFKIMIPKVKNSQIVISFDNFIRNKCDYERAIELSGKKVEIQEKNLVSEYINKVSYKDNEKFKIFISKGSVEKAANNNKGKNQGFKDIKDYNINLGYYENIEGTIDVYVDNIGDYEFNSIKVYAIPMNIYEENAEKLHNSKYRIKSFSNKYVNGYVEAEKDSILYLSIIDTVGWKVYIDGKQAKKINNTNIAFTGVEIPSGYHNVELKYSYPGKKFTMIITIAGVIILILILMQQKKPNLRNRRKNNNIF